MALAFLRTQGISLNYSVVSGKLSSPSGSLFSSQVSLTTILSCLKLGDKEFCVNMDTQPATIPCWSLLFVCADNIAVTRIVGSVISELLWIVSLLL